LGERVAFCSDGRAARIEANPQDDAGRDQQKHEKGKRCRCQERQPGFSAFRLSCRRIHPDSPEKLLNPRLSAIRCARESTESDTCSLTASVPISALAPSK